MKYRFLGTSAAEGIPAVFCNCPVCRAVREKKDGYTQKDVRTRCQSMINDDMLLDLPMDSQLHAMEYNLHFGEIRYLLISHPHCDHLDPQELLNRDGVGHGRNLKYDLLEVVLTQRSKDIIDAVLARQGCPKHTYNRLNFHVVKPYDTVDLEDYTVTALPANHMEDGVAVVYLVTDKKEGKTVFQCNDTALPEEGVFEYLKEHRIHLDFVEMDATLFGADYIRSHMGIVHDRIMKERLLADGVADEKTVFYLNHFTHNEYEPYDKRAEFVAKDGFSVSYDGLEVRF